MYTTGKDSIPSKPVISSLTHANRELADWLQANDLSQLPDADGLVWALKTQVNEQPCREDLHRRTWEILLTIVANATAEDFVRTGTLDPVADERLIKLLNGEDVPLRMRPQRVTAHSIEEARTLFAHAITDLRKRLLGSSLHATKRALINQYVSESVCFKLRQAL